jgi:hypothetical protein
VFLDSPSTNAETRVRRGQAGRQLPGLPLGADEFHHQSGMVSSAAIWSLVRAQGAQAVKDSEFPVLALQFLPAESVHRQCGW